MSNMPLSNVTSYAYYTKFLTNADDDRSPSIVRSSSTYGNISYDIFSGYSLKGTSYLWSKASHIIKICN